MITFPFPDVTLGWCGLKNAEMKQAWREKITLCFIALLLGGVVGYVTMGLNKTLCPNGGNSGVQKIVKLGASPGKLTVVVKRVPSSYHKCIARVLSSN